MLAFRKRVNLKLPSQPRRQLQQQRQQQQPQQIQQLFRPSVGAIIFNRDRKVLCGKRVDIGYWQFPQGGVDSGEDHVRAAFREVAEELGLSAENLKITEDQNIQTFTYYRKIIKDGRNYDGQEQRYILFRWDGHVSAVNLHVNGQPEFSKVAWLTWDELLPVSVPSRTDIYRKLRDWAENVIDKYVTVDDLVAYQNSDGISHFRNLRTRDNQVSTSSQNNNKDDRDSLSWLSTHQPLTSTNFFTKVFSNSGSDKEFPTENSMEIRDPIETRDSVVFSEFNKIRDQSNSAISPVMLDMGITNYNYLVEQCKYL